MTQTHPATDSPPQGEGAECFSVTDEQVLWFVRDEAARRDPDRAHIYNRMSPGRIKDATTLAQALLETHLALRRRTGRQARTGRRRHAQEIYRLLDTSNDAALVAAIAYLESALGVLPLSRSWRED